MHTIHNNIRSYLLNYIFLNQFPQYTLNNVHTMFFKFLRSIRPLSAVKRCYKYIVLQLQKNMDWIIHEAI